MCRSTEVRECLDGVKRVENPGRRHIICYHWGDRNGTISAETGDLHRVGLLYEHASIMMYLLILSSNSGGGNCEPTQSVTGIARVVERDWDFLCAVRFRSSGVPSLL